MDFFTFWVSELWGSPVIAFIALCFLYFIIGIMGRMSYMLLFSMMCLVFMVFGIGFFGMLFWFPVLLISLIYFFLQVYNLVQRSS